jgi:hypothetical protein
MLMQRDRVLAQEEEAFLATLGRGLTYLTSGTRAPHAQLHNQNVAR